MASHHRETVRRRRRELRRRLAWALAVSVLLHGAVLALWRISPGPAPGAGEDAAAPPPAALPTDALRAVSVRSPRRADAGEEVGRPTSKRLPEVRRPAARAPSPGGLSLEPVAASRGPRLALSGAGGRGAGDGRAAPPGDPSEISPPVPRSLLPQWSPPEEVRGSRVTVHVEVGSDGRPTGHVRLEPPTESESFNQRLRDALTSIRYRPATRAGAPVTAWAEITFVF